MDTRDREARDFLAVHHPFDQLTQEVLDSLAERFEIRSAARDSVILSPSSRKRFLFIIRNGAVEIQGPEGELLARLGEGDVFGHRALLGTGRSESHAHALEDTQLLRLPEADFRHLCETVPQFAYYFGPFGGERLRAALQNVEQGQDATLNLLTTKVSDLINRAPVSLNANATIREAAEMMSREQVSSLMVMNDAGLCGIVTDRDLRNRVIARGVSYDQPVEQIMTVAPLTIRAGEVAFQALLTMVRTNVHHLPVLDKGRPFGMITSTDLVHRQSASPLYLMEDIRKCKDRDDLIRASKRLPQMLVTLVESDAKAHSIGHVVSSAGQAINCRLIALAEQQLGPPPVPYAWLVGGSQGRFEQTARSDQDNCLLLSDSYQPDAHGEYFAKLSNFVCDALNDCGYEYCPGEIMATTPKWRQPLAVWRSYFDGWIEQPQPKALLNATIFFDLRCLHGDTTLFDELQRHYLGKAGENRIFLAFMAANAMQFQPPIGFFRNFVLIKGGNHDRTFDLKHRGVVPITDLARVHALAGAAPAVNTTERLEAAESTGGLSQQGASDLRDAFEFISSVRLRHQARRIKDGAAADNYVAPQEMSHFERNHLKDAFAIVRLMQSAMAQRYQTGHLT